MKRIAAVHSPPSLAFVSRKGSRQAKHMEHTRWMYHLVKLYPLSSLFPYLVRLLFQMRMRTPVCTWLWVLFENPQMEAEMLATTIVVLQFLQFILSHERYRRNHWLVQWCAWAAYYLPLPLAAYSVGLMLRFRRPYWLVAIFFAAGQTDSMSSYSLDDDRRNMRRFAKRTLSLSYLVVAFLQGVSYQRPMEILSIVLGFLAFFLDFIIGSRMMIPPSDLCMVATEHIQAKSIVLLDKGASSVRAGGVKFHAKKLQEEEEEESDPRRRVVVAVGSLGSRQSAVSGCTTYQDIMNLKDCSGLKDTCLSSALFLKLLQRYSNAPQAAAHSTSSLNRVFKHILIAEKKEEEDVYGRAFNLVEVQLSFMYDYFFSTHGSPAHTSYRLYRDYSIFKIGFLLSVLILAYPAGEAVTAKPELGTSVYAIYALILLELCQFVDYLTSNWLVVSFMCELARYSSQQMSWFLRILGDVFRRLGSERRSWQNELGQYAFVQDFDLTSLKQRLMGRLLGRPQRGTLASPVALSNEIKRWLFHKAVGAEPSKLTFLRERQKQKELSWALNQETEVQTTILIWHIATWFCAKTEEKRDYSSSDYVVATKLSSYCAYLVAFHPELLPGHHSITSSIFDRAVEEAEVVFQGTTSPDQRHARMDTWRVQDLPDDKGIIKLGVRLCRQLMMDKHDHHRWKLMADFWAEMLLLVAQSDNATAHIEHLAKGGEFVTHLWAFLYNAGMHKDRTYIIKGNEEDGKKSSQAFEGKGKALAE